MKRARWLDRATAIREGHPKARLGATRARARFLLLSAAWLAVMASGLDAQRVTLPDSTEVTAIVADRLIDGASPLRVWREYRGLSQSKLARVSGVNRVQIVEIEAGRNAGSVRTLRKLADALGVALDDIVTG